MAIAVGRKTSATVIVMQQYNQGRRNLREVGVLLNS